MTSIARHGPRPPERQIWVYALLLQLSMLSACSKDGADPIAQSAAVAPAPAGATAMPPSAAAAPDLGRAAAGGHPMVGEAGVIAATTTGGGSAGPAPAAGSDARLVPLAGAGGVPAAVSGGAGAAAGPAAGSSAAAGASPATIQCPDATLAPGDTTSTLQVGGTARTFILHVPPSYTGKSPVPLVLDWHGLGSSGAAQKGLSGYAALSDREGFIVAWPNGLDSAWNIGPCCTTSRAVDDLAFARAVVDDIERRACIDPKRVYADGYSMGGGMSYYLACNAADLFAAVAPSAFDLLTEDEEPCKPTRPISVISFRGTSDPIVPYTGGASSPPNGLNVTIHFRGAEATFEHWSTLNGCKGGRMSTSNACQTYTECAEASEVTLCTTQGGSHDPGDAMLSWEMMKRHPMP